MKKGLHEIRIDSRPFAELLNKPEDFALVLESFEHTIFESFKFDAILTGQKPKITEQSLKFRFQICEKWFRVMRGECGFGIKKTLDAIPKALMCELTGQEFDPQKDVGRSWSQEQFSIDGMIKREFN